MSQFLPGLKTYVAVPPRPNQAAAIPGAVAALLPLILAYTKDNSPEEVASDLTKMLENTSELDGYHCARELEQICCWTVDMELVEILDGASWHIYEEKRRLTELWVRDYEIAPKLAVGRAVQVRQWYGPLMQSDLKPGLIVDIELPHAEYCVFSEALGHVKDGVGTHEIILPYEVLEADNWADNL